MIPRTPAVNVLFRIVNVLAALKKFFKQKVALEMYYYTPTASELSGSRGGAPENFEFPVLFWLILSTSNCMYKVASFVID